MVGYFPDTCSYRTSNALCFVPATVRAILRISIHNRGDRISCDEVERDGLRDFNFYSSLDRNSILILAYKRERRGRSSNKKRQSHG